MNLSEIIILVAVFAFSFMGLVSIAFPIRVTQQFDIFQLTYNGRNEVRAVYGGFGLAMAAILLVAYFTPQYRSGVCITIAAALAGMAAGRLLSILIDQKIGKFPALYMCIELIGAGALAWVTNH
jgi:Domain of unknown function (DUF4345)